MSIYIYHVYVRRAMPACSSSPDFDGENGVDLADFNGFALCLSLSGPNVVLFLDDCLDVFYADWDNEVGLDDFARFQAFFT
jgi:hypothetical protein